MNKEVIEGNKLIAEFIGLERKEPTAKFRLHQWYKPNKDGRKVGKFVGYDHSLEYHYSWDWLMPIVEKINSIDNHEYDVIIWRSDCHINNRVEILFESSILRGNKTLIETVWGCIIEFIKYYNQETHDRE